MTNINQGRYSHDLEQPLVVFIIGMRINKLMQIKSWVPVAVAFVQMQKELKARKALGFCRARTR